MHTNTPQTGVLLLDKPPGISSNRALQQTKRIVGAKKAGHTGSLDPFAEGLLPICLGEATKFTQYLLNADKAYRATLHLGITTSTGDPEGKILKDERTALSTITLMQIQSVLMTFLGTHEQVPPMYSALKFHGQPLYKLARQGKTVERKARTIQIDQLILVDYTEPYLTLDVGCSKGTYIRTLAEEIGSALGCGAHLQTLRRTAVGCFDESQSYSLIDLQKHADQRTLSSTILPITILLTALPKLHLSDDLITRIRYGQRVFWEGSDCSQGLYQLYSAENEFIGLVELDPEKVLHPKRLLSTA